MIPEKALASGFIFRHETLRSALSAMLGAPAGAKTGNRSNVLIQRLPAAAEK